MYLNYQKISEVENGILAKFLCEHDQYDDFLKPGLERGFTEYYQEEKPAKVPVTKLIEEYHNPGYCGWNLHHHIHVVLKKSGVPYYFLPMLQNDYHGEDRHFALDENGQKPDLDLVRKGEWGERCVLKSYNSGILPHFVLYAGSSGYYVAPLDAIDLNA